MKKLVVQYEHDGVSFKGYCVIPPQASALTPAVLIAPDWTGRNDFVCQKAELLAQLGYIGFALDMYGDAHLGSTKEEKSALIKPLVENRQLLLARMLAAYHALETVTGVDRKRIAAMGYCFGGMCVLDLARSGINIKGVISMHGLLHAPDNLPTPKISAKILVLHGHDDPMVPPEQVAVFQKEMTLAGADWQTHVYGNTLHAFANPMANDVAFGTVYNKIADQRSWQAVQNFLAEVFAEC